MLTTATSGANSYTPGGALTLNSGTTYYIQVRAKDAAGNWSAWADCQGTFIYDNAAPSVPANIHAATGSAGAAPDTAWHTPTQRPTIQWDASTDAGAGLHDTIPYKIKIGTTSGGTERLGETNCSTNSYALGVDLTAGTKYYVNVMAQDALGNETGYQERVMYYDVMPPSDPGAPVVGTDFLGTRWTNDLTPRVDWGNSTDTPPGEMHQTEPYTLRIGSTPGDADILGDTFVTSVMYIPSSDLSLTTGNTYHVNVKAKDAANIENASGYIPGTFKFDNTPPTIAGTPTLKAGSPAVPRLDVVYTNSATPDLDWADGDDGVGVGLGAGAYEVKVGSTPDGVEMLAVTATNDSELDDAGLAPMTNGQTYHISVRVKDQLANWSHAADPWYVGSFVFDNEGPTPPGTPTTGVLHGATYYTDDLTPQIDWAASTDALSGMPTTSAYEIKIGTTPNGFDIVSPTLVNSNTYTPSSDLGLTDGHTYYISVRAFDALGNPSHGSDPWVGGVFVYDSGGPTFSNEVPTDLYETNEANPAISIDIADAGSGVNGTSIVWAVTDPLAAPVTGTPSWTDPTAAFALATPLTVVAQEGTYSMAVTAEDNLGNSSTYPSGGGHWRFVFDMTPPTLTSSTVSFNGPMTALYVDGSGKVYTNDDTPTVTFNVADALSGFDGDGTGAIVVKDKSGTIVLGTPTFTPSGMTATATWNPSGTMPKGEYTATLTIDDDAENEAEYSKTFRIDTEAPNAVVGSTIWAGSRNIADGNWYTNSRRPTWHWENPGDPDLETGVPGSQIKNYDLYLVKNKGIGETIVDASLGGTNGTPIVVPTSETDWEVWQPAGDLPLVAGDQIGVYIRARDNAMNATAYADPPVIFDPDPPTVPGTPTTTPVTVDRTPTWTWDGSTDAISGVDRYHIQIRHFGTAEWDVLDTFLDIPDSLAPANPQTWTQGLSLADGQYEIRVRAMDVAGNYSGWSGFGSVTVDATPPAAPAIQALNPGYTTSPITIDWNSVSDGGNTISYVLQIANNAGFDSPTEVTGLAVSNYSFAVTTEGEYWFRVKTISTVNVGETKESGWSAIVSTIYDHTGPEAPTLMLETPNPTNESPQTWSWSAPAGATGYKVNVNGAGWTDVHDTRTYQTAFTATGTYTFAVKAYDWLGTEGPEATGNTVEVDVTPPDVPTGLAVTSPTTDKTPTWSWTTVSGAAGYEIRLDGAIIRDVATAVSYTHAEELGDGAHILEVRSYDALGNKSAWCTAETVTVDTLAPAAPAITALAPGYTTSPIAIDWNDVTDGANGITYVLQIANNAGFDSPTEVTGLAFSNYSFAVATEGEYWFRVKTISTVNVGQTKESGWSAIVSTIYDHTSPAAPVLMLETPNPTNQSPQTWSWSAPAGATGYKVNVNSAGWTDVHDTRTYQTAFTATATYTFAVKAYDWLGTESPEATGNVEVDVTPPAVPTGLTVTTPTTDKTPTWSWTTVSGAAGYEIRLDGAIIRDVATAVSYTHAEELGDGAHTLEVGSYDTLGNKSGWCAAETVTVDTLAPAAPAIMALAPGYTTSPIAINWNDVTDGANAITYVLQYANNEGFSGATSEARSTSDYSFDAAAAGEGEYWFRVKTISTLPISGETKESGWSPIVSTIYDVTGPAAPVLMLLTPDPTNESPQTWSWSAPAGATRYEVKADDGAWINVDDTRTYQTTFATTGTHTFKVKAYDWLDNEGPEATRTVYVDLAAPAVPTGLQLTEPDGTDIGGVIYTADETPKVKWTAVDDLDLDHYVVEIDGQAWINVGKATAYHEFTEGLADGQHTVKVKAVDELGNESLYSAALVFTVDTTPPAVPGMPQTTTPTNSPSPAWTWGAVTGAAQYHVFEDEVDKGFVTEPTYTSTNLTEGTHYVQVTALDALGNESAKSEAGYVVIDLTAPVVPEMAGLPAYTNADALMLVWTAVDSAVKYDVEYTIAGVVTPVADIDVQTLTINIAAPTAVDGNPITAKVRAYDAVGNVSGWSEEVSTTVDRTGPVVSIVTTPTTLTNNPRPTWAWSGDDEVSEVDYYIVTLGSELPFETEGTSFTPASNLADGAHVLKVKAVDIVGNPGAEVAFAAVVVDTTPPAAPGMPQTTTPTNNQSPAWTWGAVTGAAQYHVFEDEVDKGFVTATTYASTNLTEGTHYVQVTALDALGNESAKSEAGYVVIDLTAPVVPEMAGLPAYTNADALMLVWTAVDSAVKYDVEYTIAGVATAVPDIDVQTLTVIIAAPTAVDGNLITAKVRAYDAVGNVSGWSEEVSTTVDRTGPVVSVVTTPTSPTNNPRPTWAWSGADPLSGVDYYIVTLGSELPFETEGTSFTPASNLADGAHVLKVKAVDKVGNVGADLTFATVTIDTTPPAAPGMPTTATPTNDNTPTWTWTASSADAVRYNVYADGAFVGYVATNEYPSATLTDGMHTLEVTALDELGNESARSTPGHVVIDTTPPAAPVMNALPEWTNAATLTFNWNPVADAVKYDLTYSLDGGANWTTVSGLTTISATVDISGAAEGAVVKGKVMAYDALNNGGAWSNEASTKIDRVGPVVTKLSPVAPMAPTNNTTVTWTWSAVDAGCGVKGFWVTLDSETPVWTTDMKFVKAISAGVNHVLKVKGEDLLGNIGAEVVFDPVNITALTIFNAQPLPGEIYKINMISTVAFEVSGLVDAPVTVSVGTTQLAAWRVVKVSQTGTNAKFYVLLDEAVMAPGKIMTVTVCVGSMSASYEYEVETERSGFGFGRLRPW
ncbi:MAG: Ig-like domain-containing protein [Clostridia bacterium]|nr:Ig-like domain-containing protein [Clostridia bacterium]